MEIVGTKIKIFLFVPLTQQITETQNTAEISEISEISGVPANIVTAGSSYNWYKHQTLIVACCLDKYTTIELWCL